MTKFEIDLIADYVDDPSVREIFADGMRFVSCSDGVLKLELTVNRPHLKKPLPEPPQMRAHAAARLALTMNASALLLQHIKANLEQQGALQVSAVSQMPPQPKH